MKIAPCDPSQFSAFLVGNISDHEEAALIEHLNHCDSCAQELEQQAADHSSWNEAQSLLKDPFSIGTMGTTDGNTNQSLPLSARQVLNMLDPTDDPESLGRVGGYEVMGVVGSGAMGVVLKATDGTLDRVVALKVMNPSLAECGTARQRFAREAKAAAGVLHPNVIAIHSVSTDQKLPYLVMPYVKGTSLQKRLDQQGPLSLVEILRIGIQVAGGLAAAHHLGLIHRDIKPSNIMLDSGVETAVITDFGLARTIDDATMTRSGAITGTPEFMSPEQARGEAIDVSSDVFSLGSVLYMLCTGQSPFRARTSFGVLRKINDDFPKPIREFNPEIPQWFCRLVEKMHAKTSGERPSSVQVHEWLKGGLAHVNQPDRIQLPKQLSANGDTPAVGFSRPFQLGAFIVMTIFILSLIVAFNPSSGFWGTGTEAERNQETATDDSAVFKTLNLSFANPKEKGKLVIDINRGFIEVVGHDRSDVIIEILNPTTKNNSAKDDSKLRPRFSPKFDLYNEKAKNLIKLDTYNQSFALNLRVKVPYETDLDLDTYYDGYIKVKQVKGTIRTHSQNCDISLLDISGSASTFGYNGDVKVQFNEVADDAVLDFESYNGSIDLTLPRTIAATTAVSSGQGIYYSAFESKRISSRDLKPSQFSKIRNKKGEYEFETINGGGVPIRIECEKGKVQIRKGMSSKLKTLR